MKEGRQEQASSVAMNCSLCSPGVLWPCTLHELQKGFVDDPTAMFFSHFCTALRLAQAFMQPCGGLDGLKSNQFFFFISELVFSQTRPQSSLLCSCTTACSSSEDGTMWAWDCFFRGNANLYQFEVCHTTISASHPLNFSCCLTA